MTLTIEPKTPSVYAIPGIPRTLSLTDLLKDVSDHFDIPIDLLKSESRKQNIKDARQVYMISALRFTKFPSGTIGKLVERDHATVLHARKKYDEDYTLRRKTDGYINDRWVK
jgi:chromosomal replication initiator protein